MTALVIGNCPQIAEQLSTFCDRVVLIVDQSFPRGRFIPEEAKYEHYFSNINIATCWGIWPKVSEIISLIKHYDATVLYSNDKWSMVASKISSLLLLRHKLVLLATNHNSYAWLDENKVSKMALLIKYCTDCYVALASFVKDKLINNGLKEEKIILVPNTVEYNSWEFKLNYDGNSPLRGIYVAYICPGKRQDLILDALNIIKGKYDITIDCFGDKDEFPQYVNLINDKIITYELEKSFFLRGRIENEELRHIMKDYDFYVCPSHMEMSPMNVLEAKAAALPVVAAEIGGIPDLVSDNVDGILFKVDDAEDLARQLASLSDSRELRERIGKSGRRQVSDHYTKKESGMRLKEVVLRVLEEKYAEVDAN